MMRYPLAIERFQNEPEFEKVEGKEFLQLFINAVNEAYEIGKRTAHSGFCLTAAMLKAWQKSDYGRDMVLARQRIKQSIVIPIDRSENRIFVSVYGKMVDNSIVNKAIRSALARLEGKGKLIEDFTVHALRDTFATRYIEQGGSPQTLKTILGHSSLAVTMDLYSHVLPNTKQKEMDNLKIAL